ncbi:flavoprotein [Kribbella sp. NPDC023972]|uniref:flavoprotein n=1 Tax=Kribbella sp. NPDC023972 TaxID=3154795 RepID=UPI0033F6C8A0
MTNGRVLHLFVCGAGPAKRVHDLIGLAHDDGWDVYCAATGSAVEHFIDVESLARLTGHPVRTTYRSAGTASTPQADAVIVAPATYNTINKWAAGIADNYVLTQLAELTGLGVRVVVLPFVNQALARNLSFIRSVAALREAGVRVLFGPGEFEPHAPRTGDAALERYPWALALKSTHD